MSFVEHLFVRISRVFDERVSEATFEVTLLKAHCLDESFLVSLSDTMCSVLGAAAVRIVCGHPGLGLLPVLLDHCVGLSLSGWSIPALCCPGSQIRRISGMPVRRLRALYPASRRHETGLDYARTIWTLLAVGAWKVDATKLLPIAWAGRPTVSIPDLLLK